MNQTKRDIFHTVLLLLFTSLANGVVLMWAISLKGQTPQYVHIDSFRYDASSSSVKWAFSLGDLKGDTFTPASKPTECSLIEGEHVVVCDLPIGLSDDTYAAVTQEVGNLLEHAYNIQQLVAHSVGTRAGK